MTADQQQQRGGGQHCWCHVVGLAARLVAETLWAGLVWVVGTFVVWIILDTVFSGLGLGDAAVHSGTAAFGVLSGYLLGRFEYWVRSA